MSALVSTNTADYALGLEFLHILIDVNKGNVKRLC